MKKKITPWPLIFSCCAMVCLILDSQCAASAAANAIKQCLTAVVPSLFPLFVIANYAIPMLAEIRIPLLSRFCKLPCGGESIFLLGLLGGFPIGAQCISQTSLPQKNAQRMLGFCNNCGPAFIFGILGCFFNNKMVPLVLMLIQATTALMIAHLWPGNSQQSYQMHLQRLTISQAVQRAIRSMSTVCAWILLGNVILSFAQRWIFPFLPNLLCIILSGILELSNGCFLLPNIPSEPLRFVIAAGFICFGGVCVLLQIHAIVSSHNISMIPCIVQKLLQAVLGCAIAALYLRVGICALPIALITAVAAKKAVEKILVLLYNVSDKGGIPYAVSQTD